MFDADEPFDMIFDMTGYKTANDLPIAWVKRMLQICPPAILASVHVSHPLFFAD
jgi:neurofibromin 1